MTFEIQQEDFSERRWLTVLSNGRAAVSVIATRRGSDWKIIVIAGGRSIIGPRIVENSRAKGIYDGIVGRIQRDGL